MADPSLIAKPSMEYAHPARESSAGRGMGILTFIAAIFLVLVGLGYGGVYFYRQSLEEALDGLTRTLSQLEEDLDAEVIQEIARVDRGLTTARALLAAHVYSSNLFSLLENHTLSDVYYSDFTYSREGGAKLVGRARDFIVLHRQLEALRTVPLVTAVTLEDIELAGEEEGTRIDFTIHVAFAENLFRF
ncbi:MAG: Uncharacterized protein G01um101470_96 [Parcubacteria group bacterium Gr01-1014_70]|nr:MAG: Uncharacterized protein G01um101470_96 [Parcubacteria group bacterium Gr01-1014_70]